MMGWIKEQADKPDSYNAGLAWIAIRQLQERVDALSRPAPAAPDEEVTEAMVLAGLEVFYAPVPQRERIATIYRAMRAAAAPTPGPLHPAGLDAQIVAHERNMAEQQEWLNAVSAPTPEPSAQEPSEELRLLRELRGVLLEIGTADWWQRRRGLNMAAYSYATEEIARLLAALDAAEGEGR